MFPTFEIVKSLAAKQGLSLNDLEAKVGFSRNSLYSWKNSSPKPEKLNVVADFFNVSTDYLLGRTDNPKIATSNENEIIDFKEIAKESMAYDGHQFDDEDIEFMSYILEQRFKNKYKD